MAHDQRAAIAALFDRMVDVYDNVGVDFFQPIAARLVDELAPAPGERALDIGCGRGAVLHRLADAVAPDGWVRGIDLSPAMVAATASDVAHLDHVRVEIGDAQEPDLDAATFDLAASSLVVFFLPDPGAALAAWRELLVDGGRFGMSTFGPYTDLWRDHVDSVFEPYLPQALVDARTTGAEGPFSSVESTRLLVQNAGFRDARSVEFDLPVTFDSPEQWEAWSRSVGQRRLWEAIDPSDLERVQDDARIGLELVKSELGRYGFDQGVRLTLAVK